MKTIPETITSSAEEAQKDYDDILDNFELTICIICGREVEPYWEKKYKGLRASCSNCKINWAES